MIELEEFSVVDDVPIEDFPEFVPLEGPVWRSGHGALRPACYPQSSQIALRARVKAGQLSRSPVEVVVQAKAGSSLKFEGSGRISRGSTLELAMPAIAGRLSSQVKVRLLQLDWRFKEAGGNWNELAQTDAITIYQTHGVPMLTPYDLALEKSCGYVKGAADPRLALCKGIAKDIRYDPSESTGGHVLDVYGSHRGDCNDHALLMEHLCLTLGIDARSLSVWGGALDRRVTYRFLRGGEILKPTLRLDRPAHDDAVRDPHFNHHVLVESEGRIFDPSYGKVVHATALEVAPNVAHHEDHDLPLKVVDKDWQCPH